jgi:hypothetical protein
MKKNSSGVLLSLPPKLSRPIGTTDYGPAIRQEVVDRWSLCVDHVYSFNNPEESALLSNHVLNVEFIECSDLQRPKIATMSAFAVAHALGTVVIANADCIPVDTKLIKEIILQVGPDDLCLLRRANINTSKLQASREVFHGIDAFILGSNAAAAIPQSAAWAIGDVVWDIWLPLFLMNKGFNVYGADTHVIAHFDHETRWNQLEWLQNARKMLAEISMDAPIFGEAFRLRNRERLSNLTDRNVQSIFDDISELLFQRQRPVFKDSASFNSLWMNTLKTQLGPDDHNFHAYVAAAGKPIRRWLIKNLAGTNLAKWLR